MLKFNRDFLLQIINESGLSQIEFSYKFDIHKNYLNDLACGRRKAPGFKFFSKMYLAGYNINDFFIEE